MLAGETSLFRSLTPESRFNVSSRSRREPLAKAENFAVAMASFLLAAGTTAWRSRLWLLDMAAFWADVLAVRVLDHCSEIKSRNDAIWAAHFGGH